MCVILSRWAKQIVAYAMAGRTGDAESILKQLDEKVSKGAGGPGFRVATLTALGRKQEALDALEEGYINNDGAMIWLRVDPRFDPLRQEPRFTQLLARLTFAAAVARFCSRLLKEWNTSRKCDRSAFFQAFLFLER